MRENYDYLLDHPYEFPGHFMRFSRASYMPKSDLRFVMLLTVLILSAMQFYFLKSRYEIQIKEIKRSSQYQARGSLYNMPRRAPTPAPLPLRPCPCACAPAPAPVPLPLAPHPHPHLKPHP